MNERPEGRTLRDYIAVLRQRALLIVVVTALTAGLAIAYSLHQSPLYRASVPVYIKNKSLVISQGTVTPVVNTLTADRVLETQSILARTNSVASTALGP